MNPRLFQRPIKIAVSLCFCLLVLSGCWDRREINDMALVLAVGLDYKSANRINLSVEFAIPESMGGGQMETSGNNGPSTMVEQSQGQTISDAIARLQEKVSRQIFWGHNHIIIIGEKMAKHGIQHTVDFFSRHPDSRLHAFVYASKGNAADLLTITPALEQNPANFIRELTKLKLGVTVTIKDLLEELGGDTKSIAIPRIEQSTASDDQNKTVLRENGSAILNHGKMVGYIDDKATRGVLILRNEIEKSTITFHPPGTDHSISFNQIRTHTTLIPEWSDGEFRMKVNVEAYEDVVENDTPLNLMDIRTTKMLEDQLSQVVKSRIDQACRDVQRGMKTDVFGFGEAFHRAYPKQWTKVKSHWNEVFSKTPVSVHAHVKIRRSGMTSNSPE
ncbi:Ger(x)C family spore germination protein [Camelliibacillus cellulosilyticus]|uniref:Ger(X)C family spore germination protein n=1 Tax=Camelliibacillus cellulosilyticus TaxID=2174486 RepID=A0ABV9GTD7_9BACL